MRVKDPREPQKNQRIKEDVGRPYNYKFILIPKCGYSREVGIKPIWLPIKFHLNMPIIHAMHLKYNTYIALGENLSEVLLLRKGYDLVQFSNRKCAYNHGRKQKNHTLHLFWVEIFPGMHRIHVKTVSVSVHITQDMFSAPRVLQCMFGTQFGLPDLWYILEVFYRLRLHYNASVMKTYQCFLPLNYELQKLPQAFDKLPGKF